MEKLARSFVEVVRRKGNWPQVTELSRGEAEMFLELLHTAGFTEVVGLEKEQARAPVCGGGLPSSRVKVVNNYFPFACKASSGYLISCATGWLDEMVCQIKGAQGDIGSAVEFVIQEIRRSVPLKPINLTADDVLKEQPPQYHGYTYLVDHMQDGDKLAGSIGLHSVCGGILTYKQTSEGYCTIRCQCSECGLRVVVPVEIKTYKELREYLLGKLVPMTENI